MVNRPRDSQRSKVYASERAEMDLGKSWETVPEMQEYAIKLVRSAWFKRRWWLWGITIHSGAGNRRATCSSSSRNPVIKMPKWARHELWMLHEIAHATVNNEYGFYRVAGHGPEFISNYLTLVRHQIGDETWRTLRQSFLDNKVRIKKPSKTKRKLTPEQRAAAVERLAAARAAKSAKS